MESLNPRPSLLSQGQTDGTPQSEPQRRTSLSFFRRVSSSDRQQARSTGSGNNNNMLFKKSAKDTHEEVTPEPVPIIKPRIPSFHFDAMNSHPPRFDSTSYLPHRLPRRDIEHLGRTYNPQYKSAIPPVPPIPTMPYQKSPLSSPAQENGDPFVKTSSMTSTTSALMKDRGR